jgi:hypothetical protein
MSLRCKRRQLRRGDDENQLSSVMALRSCGLLEMPPRASQYLSRLRGFHCLCVTLSHPSLQRKLGRRENARGSAMMNNITAILSIFAAAAAVSLAITAFVNS